MINNNSTNSAAAGFTLIEIAVAIAILGLGLATLVALQTRYMATYETERNRTTAALAAEYILTKLENAKEVPELGGNGGDLKGLLEKEGYYEYQPDAVQPENMDDLTNWTYQLTVTSQDIPPDEDVLRRLDLNLVWDQGASDFMNFVYYIKVPKQTSAGPMGIPGNEPQNPRRGSLGNPMGPGAEEE